MPRRRAYVSPTDRRPTEPQAEALKTIAATGDEGLPSGQILTGMRHTLTNLRWIHWGEKDDRGWLWITDAGRAALARPVRR